MQNQAVENIHGQVDTQLETDLEMTGEDTGRRLERGTGQSLPPDHDESMAGA